MGTVAYGVSIRATNRVVPERGTATKFVVRVEDTTVYDVGVGTIAGGAIVDVRRRAGSIVGNGSKTPGRSGLVSENLGRVLVEEVVDLVFLNLGNLSRF